MQIFKILKNNFIIFILFFSYPAYSEKYNCSYKEFDDEILISFDRITHSHFRKCSKGNCDDKKYPVIYADGDNLIFGDVKFDNQKDLNSFQLVIIDKNSKVFNSIKIASPNSNNENVFIKGVCEIN